MLIIDCVLHRGFFNVSFLDGLDSICSVNPQPDTAVYPRATGIAKLHCESIPLYLMQTTPDTLILPSNCLSFVSEIFP